MTSCEDILGLLSRKRLAAVARRFELDHVDRGTQAELAAALSREVGDHLLAILADLTATELASICETLGLEPGELARLATPPTMRADCENGIRPCPYRRCRYLVDERAPTTTCVLDVADREGEGLLTIGRVLGVSRQRAQQIEAGALRRFEANAKSLGFHNLVSDLKLSLGVEGGERPSVAFGGTLPPAFR